MMSKISSLSSSKDFIVAAKSGDIETVRKLLAANPRAINSIDVTHKKRTAMHIACKKKDWDLLRFLAKQDFVDFNMCDYI